ncbi:MAG: alkaline phosphatase [Spirochaetales bacterium]|nr:alkaline phosphatase [Spirochaetales bacterium]
MKNIKYYTLFIMVVFSSCHIRQNYTPENYDFYKTFEHELSKSTEGQLPENIILLIGDGMGLAQIELSSLAVNGLEEKLTIEKMPYTGLMKTHSLGGKSEYTTEGQTTDSAAAITAMATGKKTLKGRLAVDKDGNSLESIADIASDFGWITGVVATKSITDATPAGFYAKAESRDSHYKIAEQLLNSPIDIAFGGGAKYFADKQALIESRGINLVKTKQELANANSLPVLGLFADENLNETAPEPIVYEMADKAIDLADATGKPFFLMIEGSKIDTHAHRARTHRTILSTLHFDMAVKSALEYAYTNKDTLVIVLADHETGGLIIHNYNGEISHQWTSFSHTNMYVSVFSYGPGAESFTGLFDNTEVFTKLKSVIK